MAGPGRPKLEDAREMRVRVDRETYFDLKLLAGLKRRSEADCLKEIVRQAVESAKGTPTNGVASD